MHYLIDGYNLLFRVLKAGDTLQHQREEITSYLEQRLSAIGLDATLIFDSHYREEEGSRRHLHSLEIIFTGHGESADAQILRFLKEAHSPQDYTVVTSDKTLARLCRLKLAKTESIDEFWSFVHKRYKNKMKRDAEAEAIEIKKESVPPPLSPPKAPAANATAESCFDYYLKHFEEATEKAPDTPPKKKSEPVPEKMKKVKAAPKKEPPISDEERWLKAFENPSTDEHLD